MELSNWTQALIVLWSWTDLSRGIPKHSSDSKQRWGDWSMCFSDQWTQVPRSGEVLVTNDGSIEEVLCGGTRGKHPLLLFFLLLLDGGIQRTQWIRSEKLRTVLRPDVGQRWKTIENWNIWSTRTGVLQMFLVFVSALFRSSTVRDAARGHTSRSIVALCSLKRHSSTATVDTNPHLLHILLNQASLPGRVSPPSSSRTAHRDITVGSLRPTWHCQVQRVIVIYRRILKGNQRRLLQLLLRLMVTHSPFKSSSSAAAQISGVMLKNSVYWELVQCDN